MVMCKDVVENIIGYIEAELDDKTLDELERHLHECPECQAFVRTYKKMLELTGKLRERTFVTPEIRQRLKELLKSKLKPN
ncbi:MAG TPA: zf-HC2 domain-containing protein [Thermodesulfobacteriota bacterium]|nr:zf-HC2 domain-containing protein [Thermodesulfobacteriota bacterium]